MRGKGTGLRNTDRIFCIPSKDLPSSLTTPRYGCHSNISALMPAEKANRKSRILKHYMQDLAPTAGVFLHMLK